MSNEIQLDIKKTLLERDGLSYFIIHHNEDPVHFLQFEIYEVESWDHDDNPYETELYCSGYIKWDGCANINFSDCIHLCGKESFDLHIEMMTRLFEYASENIKKFDKDVAGVE